MTVIERHNIKRFLDLYHKGLGIPNKELKKLTKGYYQE